jgi:branched-chain amino acid transport system substrate-binding protein
VASIGIISGPAGSATLPLVQGAQLWSKYVNQKGGLNGHQVQIIVYDDGGDPGRHRAQVQEAIESHHVVAFVANAEFLAGKSSVEYVTSKRVPVIGNEGGSNHFYDSPMYFTQASTGDYNFRAIIAGIASQTVPVGKTKLGSINCAEAQSCANAEKIFSDHAKELGFDYVYRGRASLAQPDYTAECLSARNAGVEVFLLMMDTNTDGRVANSCARQGYRPIFATGGVPVVDRWKRDPNLNNMISVSNVFPWFQTGTPATDEFQQALKTFGSGLENGVGLTEGWVAGKLLERAGATLPEPPSSTAILAGLWSLRDDTLGGITQPLTFVESQPSEPRACWFNIKIENGTWTNPDGNKLRCT